MTVDLANFTPGPSLAGGLVLGVAVAAFLLFNGRVLGVSGILGGLLRSGDRLWRMLFIAGMLLAPWVFGLFAPVPESRIEAGWPLVIVAGLVVGWGTSMGSGCTSGHGVCGISRLSPRSTVATVIFVAAGMAAVFVVRHLLR